MRYRVRRTRNSIEVCEVTDIGPCEALSRAVGSVFQKWVEIGDTEDDYEYTVKRIPDES